MDGAGRPHADDEEARAAPAFRGNIAVIFLRSLLFHVLFYLNLAAHVIAATPTYPLPQSVLIQIARSWGITSLWLLRLPGRPQGGGPRAGGDAARRLAGGRQAPVGVGDLRAAGAVSKADRHRQARADVAAAVRLVRVEVRHDSGRAQRRARGLARPDRALARRARARGPGPHLPGGHAARGGRQARLQARHRADLRRARRALPADRAQFGAVLAAPQFSALPRHGAGRDSRPAAAGAEPARGPAPPGG